MKTKKPFKLPIPLDLLKAYGKAMKQVPGSPKQKETLKQIEMLRSTIKEDNERIPRKPGQPAGSKKHSDLYTDENPKGTIQGLKFATTQDAKKSVNKIKSSGRSHAHKIQAAIAMEQRARVMGKTEAAGVYRGFINSMKKKTEDMREDAPANAVGTGAVAGIGVGPQGEPGVNKKKRLTPFIAFIRRKKPQ